MMMVWNQIDVLEVKIPKKGEKIILSHSLFHFQFLKMKFPGPKFNSWDNWMSHLLPITQSIINGIIWYDCSAGSLIPVGGNLLQKALQSQKKNSNFPYPVPFPNTKISEQKFDRLGGFFAQWPISQLTEDGMRPNWGTGSQNPRQNGKFISSHFQFLKTKFAGPKVHPLTEIFSRTN